MGGGGVDAPAASHPMRGGLGRDAGSRARPYQCNLGRANSNWVAVTHARADAAARPTVGVRGRTGRDGGEGAVVDAAVRDQECALRGPCACHQASVLYDVVLVRKG